MPLVWTKQLCDELSCRVGRDQQARGAIESLLARSPNRVVLYSDPEARAAIEHLEEVDRGNTAWLKGLIEQLGWPLRFEVGPECSWNAWLLVQHADHDLEFQRRCLDLMRRAPQGEVDPANIAYLCDRVRLAEGQAQLYGTQIECVDGVFRPCSLAAPEDVDKRRMAAGLEPADYLKSFGKLGL